jgi:hypothetical protein
VLDELEKHLDRYGQIVHESRTMIDVTSMANLDAIRSGMPGVYWILTSMPSAGMASAIKQYSGRIRKLRKAAPLGTTLISQNQAEPYCVYSGTENDIKKRLLQHLFNSGNDATGKLGCRINRRPFSNYRWIVGYYEIERLDVRYAIESWWRMKMGWPVFCSK